jgi:hypothetical protein
MSSKIRLLTRAFDLSVEGESVGEIEQLLGIVENRLLKGAPARAADALGTFPAAKMNAHAKENDVDAGERVTDLFQMEPGFIGMLGSAESAALSTAVSPEYFHVIKREGDTLVLSPKFPPKPEGSDRVEDAAMVILGGYDKDGDVPITGSRLLKSLKLTGYNLERVDRSLETLEKRGLVLTEGIRRGRRYRLSEAGRAEARKLATELAGIAGQPSTTGAPA